MFFDKQEKRFAKQLKKLDTGIIGRELVYLDETDSTNDDAMELAIGGAGEGRVVIAGSQRLGKGRRGKSWSSPPGQNIYLSVILRPDVPEKKAPLLTILAAVSVAETLKDYLTNGVYIKWPNDVMIRGKKVSGILLEMATDRSGERFYILGIGININCSLKEMPGEIADIATSLYIELAYAVSIEGILFKLVNSLDYWYNKYLSHDFGVILERFRGLEGTTGRRVSVEVGGKRIKGTAVDIDDDGFLLVEDDTGRVHKALSGELRFF